MSIFDAKIARLAALLFPLAICARTCLLLPLSGFFFIVIDYIFQAYPYQACHTRLAHTRPIPGTSFLGCACATLKLNLLPGAVQWVKISLLLYAFLS